MLRTFKIYSLSSFQVHNIVNYSHHTGCEIPRTTLTIYYILNVRHAFSRLGHNSHYSVEQAPAFLLTTETRPGGNQFASCRREWQPIPGFLPGEFHGQRSLAGYSPWGRKESDTTERLIHTHTHTHTHTICLQVHSWNGVIFNFSGTQESE